MKRERPRCSTYIPEYLREYSKQESQYSRRHTKVSKDFARGKVDYAIGEFVYMLPSDMNLRIGKVRNYNNEILISSPSFKIGTNLKINLLSSENQRLNVDVKSKEVDSRRLMVKTEPDVKPKVITKHNIESNKKRKQDVKPNIKFDRESNQDVKKPDLLSSQFNHVEK